MYHVAVYIHNKTKQNLTFECDIFFLWPTLWWTLDMKTFSTIHCCFLCCYPELNAEEKSGDLRRQDDHVTYLYCDLSFSLPKATAINITTTLATDRCHLLLWLTSLEVLPPLQHTRYPGACWSNHITNQILPVAQDNILEGLRFENNTWDMRVIFTFTHICIYICFNH